MSSSSQDLFIQCKAPGWPRPNTLAAQVLRRLLSGEHLTQISFGTAHWRLAAYVNYLRDLGWLVHSSRVRAPGRPRTIAQYWFTGDAEVNSTLAEQLTLDYHPQSD